MYGILGVLHVENYRSITCVADTCVTHMFSTCNTCVGYTPALQMYFYTYNTDVGYRPVLQM